MHHWNICTTLVSFQIAIRSISEWRCAEKRRYALLTDSIDDGQCLNIDFSNRPPRRPWRWIVVQWTEVYLQIYSNAVVCPEPNTAIHRARPTTGHYQSLAESRGKQCPLIILWTITRRCPKPNNTFVESFIHHGDYYRYDTSLILSSYRIKFKFWINSRYFTVLWLFKIKTSLHFGLGTYLLQMDWVCLIIYVPDNLSFSQLPLYI